MMNELDRSLWVVEEKSFLSCKDSFHCYDGLDWGRYHNFQNVGWHGMSPPFMKLHGNCHFSSPQRNGLKLLCLSFSIWRTLGQNLQEILFTCFFFLSNNYFERISPFINESSNSILYSDTPYYQMGIDPYQKAPKGLSSRQEMIREAEKIGMSPVTVPRWS